ncbi:MAG TPA: O-antigen ligase family protein [Terracidiphilus sp.]|nr:O-antigen ligase family protein [Terracidiphilus sp.]
MTTASQTIDQHFATTGHSPEHKAQVYSAVFVMIGIPVLAIAGGQAGVLRIVFPLLSVLVAAFLLWRSKPMYVGLVFWLWFLTPFLRRVADFQGGWTQSSAVLLAPYAAAGISVLSLLTSFQVFHSRRSIPYVCALVAIGYGFIIGLPQYPLFNVLQALLNWTVPVIFGLFIYQNRDLYPQMRRVIEKCFLYGLLLTGAYGIYQFFTLPEWDKMWMLNVQTNSFGTVEAMGIRAFSTMNAPVIFAAIMAIGLLLLFNLKGRLRLLSAACGFVGLILTISRASWVSLVAGGIFLLLRMEMRQRFRLAIGFVACAVAMACLTMIPDIHDLVWQRIETFSNPSQDVSYSARVQGHEAAIQELMQEPFGEGLGSTDTKHATEGDDDMIGPHDSTILECLYSLGWIGTVIFVAGIVVLGGQVASTTRSKDTFVVSSQAILVGFLAQCLLNSVMLGVLGFMVWTFAAMCLAEADQPAEIGSQLDQETNTAVDYAAA